MVHQGQRLPLGLEASDDLPGVHTGLDQLDRYQAFDRLELLCHPDTAHAALADRLNELIRADHRARALCGRQVEGRRGGGRRRTVEQAVGAVGGRQQRKYECDPGFIAAAGLADVRTPEVRVGDNAGGVEDRLVVGL